MPCSGGPLVKLGMGKCRQQFVHSCSLVSIFPGSPSAAGNRAGPGVLGKELSDGEVQEKDQCLKHAGRRVAGRYLGEESVSSGKLASKDSINFLWRRISTKLFK